MNSNNQEYCKPTNFGIEKNQWYSAKQFERFWSVYNKYMFYAHKDALSSCIEVKDNIAATLYQMVKAPWPGKFSTGGTSSERGSKKSSKGKKNKKRRRQQKRKKLKQTQTLQPTPDVFVLTDDDTLQVHLREEVQLDQSDEVDEDFLAFIETSVKHRIKWNNHKENKKNQNESPSGSVSTTEEEHPDLVRERELRCLYGASAAQVHGMETAIQCSFDRLSTLHQPAVWPNIPLKLSFE